MEEEIEYSPYCPVCQSCGEEGCCPATACQMSPDGKYCEGYLKDLQFGYMMYRDMYNKFNENHKEELDTIWNRNYELVYERKVDRKQLREELDKLENGRIC